MYNEKVVFGVCVVGTARKKIQYANKHQEKNSRIIFVSYSLHEEFFSYANHIGVIR